MRAVASLNRLLFAIAFFAFAFSSGEAYATVVRRAPLEEQTRGATAIVAARCRSIESRIVDDQIVSYVGFDVIESLKGPVEPGELVLRQLGGQVGDDAAWVIGSPAFEVGRLSVLFLAPNGEGAYVVDSMFYGHFELFVGDDDQWWIRRQEASGVDAINPDDPVKDELLLSELRAAIAAVASKTAEAPAEYAEQVPREYFATASARKQGHSEFALSRYGATRWFEPDSGQAIAFSYNPDGYPGSVPLGPAVSDALASWSAAGSSSLNFSFAGENTTGRGWRRDGVNRVSIDSTNQVQGSGCSSVIAIGGFTSTNTSQRITVNGTSFIRGLEADVCLNDGYCDLWENASYLRYVITHELGHCIGLDHSSISQATMYGAFLYSNASRGAALHQDDVDGAVFIYPPPPGPPEIASLSPNEGERGTTADVTITGTNLLVGGQATVTISGNGIGAVSIVTGSTSTSLRVRFSIASTASTTQRTLTVTTSQGSDSKPFSVVGIIAPSDLRATATSSSSIRLNWTDASQVETQYRVQRYNGSTSTWETRATLGAGSVTYTDTGLRASRRYKYRIKVSNATDSANSNQAEAVTFAAKAAPEGGHER